MVIWPSRFNFILPTLAATLLLTGCQTPNKDLQATLRVHMEVNPRYHPSSEPAAIYRADPILVNVDKTPILTEAFVEKADVVNTMGSFALMIKFDSRGSLILEIQTSQNPGKHLAISSSFGKKLSEVRWLAAPEVNQRINNGYLVFTPDCSREEAQLIATGLNNVVEMGKKKSMLK